MIAFFKNLIGTMRAAGLARYSFDNSGNPNGFADYSGSSLTMTNSVADWDELATVPKTSANDTLTLLVRSDNRLMRYNHALGYWQPVDSHNDLSIMWIGDSKTSQSVPYPNPLIADRSIPVYKPAPSSLFPNLNTVGTFVESITPSYGATAGAGAVLTFTKATNSMTWTAPGDSAGAAVDVSAGGWFRLESATAGKEIYISIIIRNVPAADATQTFSYAGYVPAVDYALVNSVPAMWNALNGNPFGENQYFYAIGGMTSSDMYALTAWRNKYTDITHIDLTTNGLGSKAAADQTYTDVTTMITMRRALGSRCILALPNLDNLDYGVAANIPKWKTYLAGKLEYWATTNGIEFYSPAEFLNTGNSLSAPNVAANFNTDTVHYSQRGAYLIAKYLLDPILRQYAPKRNRLANPLVTYDATDAPNGNLIVNGVFVGTAGTANAGTSGGVPTSWTASRGSGSNITAVFSALARYDKKYGDLLSIRVDNLDGSANEMIRLASTSAITAGNFTAGDKVVLSGELFAAGTGIAGIRLYLWSSTGGYVYALDHPNSADLGDLAGDTIHYVLQSMPFTIQAGFSSFVPRLEITMAAGGVATIDVVPNLCLRKVP